MNRNTRRMLTAGVSILALAPLGAYAAGIYVDGGTGVGAMAIVNDAGSIVAGSLTIEDDGLLFLRDDTGEADDVVDYAGPAPAA